MTVWLVSRRHFQSLWKYMRICAIATGIQNWRSSPSWIYFRFQFWSKDLLPVVTSLLIFLPNLANVPQSPAELLRFVEIQTAAAAILEFDVTKIWRWDCFHGRRFQPVHQTLCENMQLRPRYGGTQNGGVSHLELLFGNSGPPTTFTYGPEVAYQISCWPRVYFSGYRDLKILRICIKMPTLAPKINVYGFYP